MRIGRRRVRSGILMLAAVTVAAIVVVGCGSGAPSGGGATSPRPPASAEPSVSTAVAQTRGALAAALAGAGYEILVPNQPFRPPESPLLAAARRSVFQVAVTNDPTHGYIVVYEFADTSLATTAGSQMAAYIGSGPGRVQFAPDTRYVLQQVGTTLVFYTWSPSASPGTDGDAIAKALSAVGRGIAIPQ